MPMSPWQYKEYCEHWSELQNRAMESSSDTKDSYDNDDDELFNVSFIDVLTMFAVVLSGILAVILACLYLV